MEAENPGDWRQLFSVVGRRHLLEYCIRRSWSLAFSLAYRYRRHILRNTTIVAVVGSLGKTTTNRAIHAVLGLRLPRNPNRNAWSWPARAVLSTLPWSAERVIEVGIGSPNTMQTHRRTLEPDIVVVTAVASEHNHAIGSLEDIRHEKADMLRGLKPTQLAVLNGDDPHVLWMAGETQGRVITFGTGEDCDIRAKNIRLDWPHGMRFTVQVESEEKDICLPLFGRHFVYSALAAIAVGREQGRGWEDIIAGLRGLEPVPERLELVELPSGALLLRDDYKSALETAHAALDLLEEIPAKRKIVVFGNLTDLMQRQRVVYRDVGLRIGSIATHAIFAGTATGDFIKPCIRGGIDPENISRVGPDMRAACEALPSDLGPGDVILIKGRSSERLGRVALRLQGVEVRCNMPVCVMPSSVRCGGCPLLKRESAENSQC